MAVNSSWDHRTYRSKFEPANHWQLKEEFILAHKEEITEHELVCLANVYVNMQILGCRYPAPVAAKVRALGKDLGLSYKQHREGKLMRTFVKASDAATAKLRRSDAPSTKGIQGLCEYDTNEEATRKGPNSIPGQLGTNNLSLKRMNSEKCTGGPMEVSAAKKMKPSLNASNDSTTGIDSSSQPTFNPDDAVAMLSSKIQQKKLKINDTSPGWPTPIASGEVVGRDCLQRKPKIPISFPGGDTSFKLNPAFHGLSLSMHANKQHRACEIISLSFPQGQYQIVPKLKQGLLTACVKGVEVAKVPSGNGSQKVLHEMLAKKALEVLIKHCPLLEYKSKSRETNIGEDGRLLGVDDGSQVNSERISKESIGGKLLKMMGWSGGGLGKEESGRVDPVEVIMRDNRAGLGFAGSVSGMGLSQEFKQKVHTLLRNFSKDSSMGTSDVEELVFPAMFSKEQRAFIHRACQSKYPLKSVSYGKDQQRYLVVRPNISKFDKVKEVAQKGGETNTFKAYQPGTYDLSVFNLIGLQS